MSTTATTIIQLGNTGAQVSQIQTVLQTLGFYNGSIDGNFGPGTQAGVIQFQRSMNLTADGVVGPQTWNALFPNGAPTTNPPPTQAVVNAPSNSAQGSASLAQRCLSLTGAFETGHFPPDCFGAIGGNFDGQGMSFGCLQWNWGQGTLQPLLLQMDQQNSNLIDEYFGVNAATLRQVLGQPLAQQMQWITSIQQNNQIQQPWHDQFAALGYDQNFQAIEVQAAEQRYAAALSWCPTYGVTSERAVALMFDINVQDGSISAATQQLILSDFQSLQPTGNAGQDETKKLVIIANRRADAVSGAFQADVRARKLCIANGQGTVHGSNYNIESQFAITLDPYS